jgi:hypothetical protein
MSWFSRTFGHHKSEPQQVPLFTPEQEALRQRYMMQGEKDTNIEELSKLFRNQYEQETVPDMAEQFTAMGGGQRSSGFQDALQTAGLNLMQQLAGLKMQGGMQKLSLGLEPRFQTIMRPETPGIGETMLPILIAALGGAIGGPAGAAVGGGFGSQFKNLLGTGLKEYGRTSEDVFRSRYAPGQPRGVSSKSDETLMKLAQSLKL